MKACTPEAIWESGYDNHMYTHVCTYTTMTTTVQTPFQPGPPWEASTGLGDHLQISKAEAESYVQAAKRRLYKGHRLHLGVICDISSCSPAQQLEFNMLRAYLEAPSQGTQY